MKQEHVKILAIADIRQTNQSFFVYAVRLPVLQIGSAPIGQLALRGLKLGFVAIKIIVEQTQISPKQLGHARLVRQIGK